MDGFFGSCWQNHSNQVAWARLRCTQQERGIEVGTECEESSLPVDYTYQDELAARLKALAKECAELTRERETWQAEREQYQLELAIAEQHLESERAELEKRTASLERVLEDARAENGRLEDCAERLRQEMTQLRRSTEASGFENSSQTDGPQTAAEEANVSPTSSATAPSHPHRARPRAPEQEIPITERLIAWSRAKNPRLTFKLRVGLLVGAACATSIIAITWVSFGSIQLWFSR